jgi:hypothetical protein
MLELPTRTSSVFICHCDIVPDEEDACLSLPQDLYISTITGWTNPDLEPAIYQPMIERYRRAFPVAVGQYVTELDVNNEEANVRTIPQIARFKALMQLLTVLLQNKVLSDTALAKFLRIREKWDPQSLFPNYKKFIQTHDKINKLNLKNSRL